MAQENSQRLEWIITKYGESRINQLLSPSDENKPEICFLQKVSLICSPSYMLGNCSINNLSIVVNEGILLDFAIASSRCFSNKPIVHSLL